MIIKFKRQKESRLAYSLISQNNARRRFNVAITNFIASESIERGKNRYVVLCKESIDRFETERHYFT